MSRESTNSLVADFTSFPDSELLACDDPSFLARHELYRLVRLLREELAALKAQREPVCSDCNDTHWVDGERGRQMCQRCPVPCQKCREGGNGPFCAETPCSCECHQNKQTAEDSEEPAEDRCVHCGRTLEGEGDSGHCLDCTSGGR